MRFRAFHGVLPVEGVVGNEFSVAVTLSYHLATEAPVDDDIEGTVSYADVFEIVKEEMKTSSRLLEHVAWRIARSLVSLFPSIRSLRVRVEKVAPPIAGMEGPAAVSYCWTCD